jgi:hypothetical protein
MSVGLGGQARADRGMRFVLALVAKSNPALPVSSRYITTGIQTATERNKIETASVFPEP